MIYLKTWILRPSFLKFLKEASFLNFILLWLLIQSSSYIRTRRDRFDNRLLHPMKQAGKTFPFKCLFSIPMAMVGYFVGIF